MKKVVIIEHEKKRRGSLETAMEKLSNLYGDHHPFKQVRESERGGAGGSGVDRVRKTRSGRVGDLRCYARVYQVT